MKPEGTDLKLFALNVELNFMRRGIENGAFEKLLDLFHQVGLVSIVVIDVEVAEKVDGRECVQSLVLERKRRLRIDEVHSGS